MVVTPSSERRSSLSGSSAFRISSPRSTRYLQHQDVVRVAHRLDARHGDAVLVERAGVDVHEALGVGQVLGVGLELEDLRVAVLAQPVLERLAEDALVPSPAMCWAAKMGFGWVQTKSSVPALLEAAGPSTTYQSWMLRCTKGARSASQGQLLLAGAEMLKWARLSPKPLKCRCRPTWPVLFERPLGYLPDWSSAAGARSRRRCRRPPPPWRAAPRSPPCRPGRPRSWRAPARRPRCSWPSLRGRSSDVAGRERLGDQRDVGARLGVDLAAVAAAERAVGAGRAPLVVAAHDAARGGAAGASRSSLHTRSISLAMGWSSSGGSGKGLERGSAKGCGSATPETPSSASALS